METAAKYDRWRMTEPYTIIPAILTGTPADAEAAYKYTWDLYESLSLQEIARDPGIIRRITPFFHFPTAAKAKEYAEALANIENEYRKARDNQAKRVLVGDQASIYTEIFKQYGADKLQGAGFSARLSESGGNVAIVIRDVFATIASNVFMDSVVYRETIEAFQRNRLPNDEQTQESLDNAYKYMQLDYTPALYISTIIEEQQRETPIDYLEIIKSKCPRALKEIEMAKELLNKAQYPRAIPELAMITLADKLDAAIRESGGILPAKDRPKPIKAANKRGGGREKGMGKSANTVFNNLDILAKTALAWDRVWDGSSFKLPTIKNRNRETYGVVANLGHEEHPAALNKMQLLVYKGIVDLSERNKATAGSEIQYTPMQIKRAYLRTEDNNVKITPKEKNEIALAALSLNSFIVSCDVESGYTDDAGNYVKGEKQKYPQASNIVSRPIVHTAIVWENDKFLIDDNTGGKIPICKSVTIVGRPVLNQRADSLSRVERIPYTKIGQPVAEKRTVKTKDGKKRTATTRTNRKASRADIANFFVSEWNTCLRKKTYRQVAGKGRVFNLDDTRDVQGLYPRFGVIKEKYLNQDDVDQDKAKNRYKQACSKLRTKIKSILNGLVENGSIPAWHYNYEGKNNTGEVISVSIFDSTAAEKKARS